MGMIDNTLGMRHRTGAEYELAYEIIFIMDWYNFSCNLSKLHI